MKENLLLALPFWTFVPDVSDDMALVAALATSGMWSGGNGQRFVNCDKQLANGLGIAKCVSIS